MAGQLQPLTDAQLATIDASYVPFPVFGDWLGEVPASHAWTGRLAELTEVRRVAASDALDRARAITMRAAAFDTGAIEGLYRTDRGVTRTVAEQAAMWEQQAEEQGNDVLALFEAQLRTYELVLDAATQWMPVTEAWIRRLHEELTGPQETYEVHTAIGSQQHPLPRGEYKHHPNHVDLPDGSAHAYAPVSATGPEMARLVAELTSSLFEHAHPVLQASYAHYALVGIHPFADGNGRVARALASTYLYRAASIPLLVLADQRDAYFATLAAADGGNAEPFVLFVRDAGTDAVGMVVESLREALAPQATEVAGQFREMVTTQGGLTHTELDAVAARLAGELHSVLAAEIDDLDAVPGVETAPSMSTGGAPLAPLSGFRAIAAGGHRAVLLLLKSAPPAPAARETRIEILVSTSSDETETFRVQPRGADQEGVTLALREVHPELALSAQHRLHAFIRRILGSELSELREAAAEAMKSQGY